MRFHLHHTHLYPGARLTLHDESRDASGHALLEFSDGAGSTATYARPKTDTLTLNVAPYRTMAGTQLPAKRWALAPTGERGIWRVVAKLDVSD